MSFDVELSISKVVPHLYDIGGSGDFPEPHLSGSFN